MTNVFADKQRSERYGSFSIGLHWLMLLLIVGVYACIDLTDFFERGSDARKLLQTWHFMLGLSVLALVVVRIVVRFASKTPPIVPAPPGWQDKAAKLAHLALYALMLGMPIAGWLILSAKGVPIPFFGLELPALVGVDKELAGSIKEVHEAVGTLGYFLIGAHAAAALFHHYVMRDNTLLRMMPAPKQNSR